MRRIRRTLVPMLLALLAIFGGSIPVFADGIPPFP
jgi:hypothetical protein